MKPPMVTQLELDQITRRRLDPLAALIRAIELKAEDGVDVISDSGQMTARAVETFAKNAALDLFAILTEQVPGGLDDHHAWETQHLCILAATALNGVEMYAVPGVDGAAVVNALRSFSWDLKHRFDERLCTRPETSEAMEVVHV
jgi:hypothetical protein